MSCVLNMFRLSQSLWATIPTIQMLIMGTTLINLGPRMEHYELEDAMNVMSMTIRGEMCLILLSIQQGHQCKDILLHFMLEIICKCTMMY